MDAEPEKSDLESLLEDWEAELDESVQGPKSHAWDWTDLQKQIKDHLKKNSKTLPLSRLNQLLIISNFATLCLKGISQTQAIRALARHYQIFEALPIEKRGGSGNSRSWLYDEQVKTQTRDWLTSQKTGDVTPRRLRYALNGTIFPELNINLAKGISERTARWWLIKLGWRRTVVWKGVYMDGHEHDDIVEYRNKVFLPAIVWFEALMARHEGPELKKIMPEIHKGQHRVIIQYHDECCFHTNDEALIHVSDFVNKEDGRLVLLDETGRIIRDAQKNPWWDTKQLMDQIKYAIEIFKSAHPDCEALFIFDQSSAHASLPPDALKAFEMNKSDGGKQHKQHDTTIPQSNPDPRFRGQPQKMTTSSGQQKGLQAVLEERGFNVSCLKAKSKIVAWPGFSLSRKIL
ncbi:hypothetical protein L208DRAFT_1405913 [Tricholoma matsutake]|nr:hypothetical protein L208DRAFT_1405913 [Tricholoma matsutake 945]